MDSVTEDAPMNAPIETPVTEAPACPRIFAAMIAVMADTCAVGKDKKSLQQGFMYRGIDDVYNALHRVCARHGVFTTSEIINTEREERATKNGGVLIYTRLKMRFTFWASDGSSITTEIIGEAMDTADKSSNKAMAIAHKYALLQAFLIPTEDLADPDADAHELAARAPRAKGNGQSAPPQAELISAAQKKRLEARIHELQLDREEVKRWIWMHSNCALKSISELTRALYSELDELLDDWAAVEAAIRNFGLERDRVVKWVQAASKGQVDHLADMPEALRERLVDKMAGWATSNEEAPV